MSGEWLIKLVVFDLDDTLVRSHDSHAELIAERREDVARTLRISEKEAETLITELRKEEGITNYELYERLQIESNGLRGGDVLRDRIMHKNQKRMAEPNPTLVEQLKKLGAEGKVLSIVTESPYELTLSKLNSALIPNTLFAKIVGWEKGKMPPKSGKIVKETFSNLMAELNSSADETVAVGDEAKTDLIPMKLLGASTICVEGNKFAKLEDSEYIDVRISDINEIENAIRLIESRKALNNALRSSSGHIEKSSRRSMVL